MAAGRKWDWAMGFWDGGEREEGLGWAGNEKTINGGADRKSALLLPLIMENIGGTGNKKVLKIRMTSCDCMSSWPK